MKKRLPEPNNRPIRNLKTKGPSIEESLTRKWVAYSGNLPLASTDPEVAAQWHPTKNGEWTPNDFTRGSHELVWWKCPAGPDHVWQGIIRVRVNSKHASRGCPFCTSHQVSVTNCLAVLFPEVAKQWDFRKNGKLRPDQVVAGSEQKVWWRCQKGSDHQWMELISYRTLKAFGCPFCSGNRVSVTNSLAGVRPDLVRQWHPARNGKLTPDKVVAMSKVPVWWKCDGGSDHEWKTSCANRVGNGTGCPSCVGQKVSVTNCLQTVRPDLESFWHRTKNLLCPQDVTAGSAEVVWWQCPVNNKHEWQQEVSTRARSNVPCPFCQREQNSILNNELMRRQWHTTKNIGLNPSQITMGAKVLVWWQCDRQKEHVWQQKPAERKDGYGCPFCSGHRVCTSNSLKARYPQIAKEWHKELNDPLKPDQVLPGTNTEVWWRCEKGEDHVWKQKVSVRTHAKGGCPFCCSRRLSVTNCLATQFPEIASQWHPTKNGSLTPNQVMMKSDQKVWWQCRRAKEHEWQAVVYSRTRKNGSGCPHCHERT